MNDEKKRKIGRGLSSLLGNMTLDDFEARPSTSASDNIQNIEISQIVPNPFQPRKSFNEEEIAELSQSIKENGILQPIIVQQSENNTYTIIAGERRYRASKLAGLATIPCLVKVLDEDRSFIVAMIENIQRANLNPMEEAMGYKTLSEKFGLRHEEIAKMVGKSRSHISNMMGLLSIPTEVKTMIASGALSGGHAKVLKKIEDPEQLTQIARKAMEQKLSVRELEKQVVNFQNRMQANLHSKSTIPEEHEPLQHENHTTEDTQTNNYTYNHWAPSDVLAMEDAFNAQFQQMMHIQHDNVGNAGKVIIHYANLKELRQVMSKLIDISDVYAK